MTASQLRDALDVLTRQLSEAVQGIQSQVRELARRQDDTAIALDALGAREQFDRRTEALAAARSHVSALAGQPSADGSRTYHLGCAETIAQELLVARYLTEG